MEERKHYDVIIIGGSYAGLQAATTLGRALRHVLVIDSGQPCNVQTPHSHNFLTQDGETPAAIAAKGREQLEVYSTVKLLDGKVTEAVKVKDEFRINILTGKIFTARKLLFATGVKDIMPAIPGFAECWGISVIHCPYCHGYEVHHQLTGILANGYAAYEYVRLINNWTNELTLFTNGASKLIAEQQQKLTDKNINVVETELMEIIHQQGQVKSLLFKDGSEHHVKAIYARPFYEQHCNLPVQLGCTLSEHGLLQTNGFGKTDVPGIYAAGDNSVLMRSVANAVATGMMAAAMLNKELIEEDF